MRRYLYGADAADAVDTLLHKGVVGEAYNVSSASAVSNVEVAVRMLELFGCRPQEDFGRRLAWIADRPFNDHDYRVDGSKLAALGWRQRVPFSEGLKATVDWYRENMHVWWPDRVAGGTSTGATSTSNMSSVSWVETVDGGDEMGLGDEGRDSQDEDVDSDVGEAKAEGLSMKMGRAAWQL